MLRAPVLMRSIRQGRRTIRNNIRKLSTQQRKPQPHPPNLTSRRRIHSANSDDNELSVVIHITENKPKQETRMMTHGDDFEEDDDSVFYKDDENRFHQRYTLKLKTKAEYKVSLEIHPKLEIYSIKFGGSRFDVESLEGRCHFIWSTKNIATTDRKCRTVLPCVIKVNGYKDIHFEVLAKFYSYREVAHYNGVPLTSLSFDGLLNDEKQTKKQHYDIVFN